MKNFFKYISRLDRYIIAKFIGTYIYSIILIISISIVFDINESGEVLNIWCAAEGHRVRLLCQLRALFL